MEWLQQNFQTLIYPLIIGLATWFFSKRHYQTRDLKSKDLDILSKNVNAYQNLLDDLDKRYEDRIEKLEIYYKEQILLLEKHIEKLETEVKELKNKYENSNN